MSFIQMVLLAAACAFCRMEGGWFGECKFRQPICTSFFVGLILGNIPEALKIGAQFEMIWMGTAGIGPVAHLDVTTGGFLGTVVGMVQVFISMSANTSGAIELAQLSSGMYVAMVTTVGGLMVGIPSYFAHNYLVARIERLIFRMEATTIAFMDILNQPVQK